MKYLAYKWPEYQDYMGENWFREESYYDPEADTYLIPENRVEQFDRKNNITLKHNIGDKVTIKSLDWYNENKDKYGDIIFSMSLPTFIKEMSEYCGETATITRIDDDYYYFLDIDEEEFGWSDEMFED